MLLWRERNEVGVLCETINHYPNSSFSMGRRQLGDEIHGDILPHLIWDRKWVQQALRFWVEYLCCWHRIQAWMNVFTSLAKWGHANKVVIRANVPLIPECARMGETWNSFNIWDNNYVSSSKQQSNQPVYDLTCSPHHLFHTIDGVSASMLAGTQLNPSDARVHQQLH